jgi:hypothetical protein
MAAKVHPMKPLTPHMIAALRIAATRRSGIVSVGLPQSSRDTHKSTLLALCKRGLLDHLASGGPYYARWSQYRITDAGRTALAETDESP